MQTKSLQVIIIGSGQMTSHGVPHS